LVLLQDLVGFGKVPGEMKKERKKSVKAKDVKKKVKGKPIDDALASSLGAC
jgi:hypothetical protein